MYRLVLPPESLHGPNGRRLGLATGVSQDFHEFRDYHPGDDLRRLDWGVYARTDREVVRLYREEITPHVDLFVDVSPSMNLPGTRKGESLVALLKTLTQAAAATHCSLTQHDFLPPSASTIQSISQGYSAHQIPTLTPRSLRILVSDLLFPDAPNPLLAPLAYKAAALHVIQLLDDEEESPSPAGSIELIDCETHQRLETHLDATTLQSYHQALSVHRDRWHLACRPLGATLSLLNTSTLLTPPHRLIPLEQNHLLEPL